MREEFKLHYFSQSHPLDDTDKELTEEEKLKGYQNLCHEVGIPPSDSIAECKKHLNNTLVNIVDLIDTRRTLKKVKVWHDFEAFRKYTLQDGHRINMDEAKKDGAYLASLLQHLRVPRRIRRGGRRSASSSRAVSGRVTKRVRSGGKGMK